MNNLSEDILMRYLTGECSDEDFARVNAWIKESDDRQRQMCIRDRLRKMHIAAK